MKSKSIILATFATIVTAIAVVTAPPVSAADSAPKCSILPAKFCESAVKDVSGQATSKNSAVFMVLEWAIAVLTAGVGVVAVGAFVYAGIMYASADSKAEQVKKAKDIMVQTIIGLAAFAVLATLLLWLIPGGIF